LKEGLRILDNFIINFVELYYISEPMKIEFSKNSIKVFDQLYYRIKY